MKEQGHYARTCRMKKCYDCPEWGDEFSCGSSQHDSGDDVSVKEVNKENGAQHYKA